MNLILDKSLNYSLNLLPIGAYAMEHDYLKKQFLTIVEGAFVFQGYEPIRDEDYDKNYQLFPDQESFIKHVKVAISTGYLRAHKQKIGDKEVLAINTYDFFKWTIENLDENRFSPYLKCIWIELSAKKEFQKMKIRNNYHNKEDKMEGNQKNQFIPASKWNDYHPWPPIGGLRHLIFWRKENGFEKVLKRPSRVWLIDEKAFFKWLEERKFKFKTSKKNDACVDEN